ncbi:FMRFamide receptor-like [Watersipora subatra]|uniref:FMRFamide receptor-like n=1 Tax=Watersipora subatra TaxID=2589382 RepID=UPI00355AD57C
MGISSEVTEEELDSSYAYYCENATEFFRCLPKLREEKVWVLAVDLTTHSFVATLGIIGNILAIIVLSKDKRSSSTKTILRSLATCDLVSLLFAVLYNFSRSYIYYGTEMEIYDSKTAKTIANSLVYFIIPLSNAAVYGSHMLTVMVTIDRYIAVCKPMVIRTKKQVYVTLGVLFIYVVAYNIPLCFEYIVITYAGIYRKNYYKNDTTTVFEILLNQTYQKNVPYQIGYKITMSIILKDAGPIILLVVFNIKLHRALVRMKERYLKMTGRRIEAPRHISNSENMTRTVVIVVTTYTLLTLPGLIIKLLTTTKQLAYIFGAHAVTNALEPVLFNAQYGSISNLLISTASSANFIIYIIFARRFRKIFFDTFCGCRLFNVKPRSDNKPSSQSSEVATKAGLGKSTSKVSPIDSAMDLRKTTFDGTMMAHCKDNLASLVTHKQSLPKDLHESKH